MTPLVSCSSLLDTAPGDLLLPQKYGVTKVVYSLVYPETKAAVGALWESQPHELFGAAFLDRQDGAEDVLLDRWRQWASPTVGDLSAFGWRYVSAGSTEAIRESIWMQGLNRKAHESAPSIHIFEGEYEGYRAYASAAGLPVVVHTRDRWADSISDAVKSGDAWYISQPSAIDGNVWCDFDAWLEELHRREPGCDVLLDLTYVGAVQHRFSINANHPAVRTVFFSLSKVFGLYYQRIGGCFSRSEMPGLYGNRWFKNMFSLLVGCELMARHAVDELPTQYKSSQRDACRRLGLQIGVNVTPSDAVMLATIDGRNGQLVPNDLQPTRRGTGYRLCLTPLMSEARP